jgi:hypothetical protein
MTRPRDGQEGEFNITKSGESVYRAKYIQGDILYPLGTNEINGLYSGGAKAAVHLPVESAFTALQSVSAGNSRVVHGGFGAPAGKFMSFIRDARAEPFTLDVFLMIGKSPGRQGLGVQHHILDVFFRWVRSRDMKPFTGRIDSAPRRGVSPQIRHTPGATKRSVRSVNSMKVTAPGTPTTNRRFEACVSMLRD